MAFSLILTGCLEKEVGCLDPNAINLNVGADENGGCVYPELILNVSHRWIDSMVSMDTTIVDTVTFSLNTKYVLNNTDTVVFTDLDMYVSNVRIGDDPNLFVFDSVEQYDGTFIRDDLTVVAPNAFSFSTGHINEFGTYSGLHLTFGFSEEWRKVDTNLLRDLASAHPWFSESLRVGAVERDVLKMDYMIWAGTADPDTITRTIQISGPREEQIVKSATLLTTQTNHINVGLFFDYSKLVSQMDLRTDTEETIKSTLLNNMNAALSVIPQ